MRDLTPEEEQELAALEAEVGDDALTPEEEAELAQLEAEQAQPQEQYSPLETGAANFGNSLIAGYGPELVALAENKIASKPYDAALEQRRSQLRAMSQQNPTSAALGGAGGFIAQNFNPVTMAAGRAISGLGLAGRMAGGAALGAATGAIQNPGEDGSRLRNAAIGGAVGGVLPAVGAAVSKATKPLARMAENIRFAQNPVAVQDEAIANIASARNALRGEVSEGGKKLAQELAGKTVDVSPIPLKGVNPRLDKLVDKFIKPADGELRAQISAQNANRIRGLFDRAAKWRPGAPGDPSVSNAEQAARAANVLRDKISQVSPNVEPIQASRKQALDLLAYLRSGKPVTRVSPSSPDKAASIARISEKTGVDLAETARKLKQAKALEFRAPTDLNNLTRLIYQPKVRALVEGARAYERNAPNAATITPALADLLAKEKK